MRTDALTAISDGRQDATPVLQQLLDQRGAVHIPAGLYRLEKTLLIHSDTQLCAAPDSVFRFADGAGRHCRSFLLTNANPGNGNRNIAVCGGIWDGNASGNPRGHAGELFPYTGVALNFTNVCQLTLQDLTVCNPSSFFIRVGEVTDFKILDIRLQAETLLPNQDGIHVGGFSEHGVIGRIKACGKGVPNDDMIALNANDDVERQLNLGMRQGPIRDILLEDIEAEDAYTFIRLLSVDQPIEDITVRRLRGSCRMYGLNITNWRFPRGVGRISAVSFADLDLAKTQYSPSCPALVNIALAVDRLNISGLRRNPATLPEVQTLQIHNQQNLTLRLDGRTTKICAGDAYILPDGDIRECSISAQPE